MERKRRKNCCGWTFCFGKSSLWKTEVGSSYAGWILPQLSVFAFLYYRTYSIINISKNMGEAVRCQVHTVHYV